MIEQKMYDIDQEFFLNYPPPTSEIIERISKTLWIEPQFYIKVVQLMETMKLPLPFTCPTPQAGRNYSKRQSYETDDDSDEIMVESVPVDFLPSAVDEKERKKMKSFLHSGHPPYHAKESMIQNVSSKKPKLKIITGKKKTNASNNDGTMINDVGEFGEFHPETYQQQISEQTKEFDFDSAYSLEFIRKNRISSKDMKNVSVFKHYHSGHPSSRLYVKNISKKTTENELKQLFAAFLLDNNEESRKQFDVRLMTSGKLRGQAFISMGTVSNAEKAVKESNGFNFHSKPIVVVFARSRPALEET